MESFNRLREFTYTDANALPRMKKELIDLLNVRKEGGKVRPFLPSRVLFMLAVDRNSGDLARAEELYRRNTNAETPSSAMRMRHWETHNRSNTVLVEIFVAAITAKYDDKWMTTLMDPDRQRSLHQRAAWLYDHSSEGIGTQRMRPNDVVMAVMRALLDTWTQQFLVISGHTLIFSDPKHLDVESLRNLLPRSRSEKLVDFCRRVFEEYRGILLLYAGPAWPRVSEMIPPFMFLSRLLANITKVYPAKVCTDLNQFYQGRLTKKLYNKIEMPHSASRATANRRQSMLEDTSAPTLASPGNSNPLQELYETMKGFDMDSAESSSNDCTAHVIRDIQGGHQVSVFLENLLTHFSSSGADGTLVPSQELNALIPAPGTATDKAHQLLNATDEASTSSDGPARSAEETTTSGGKPTVGSSHAEMLHEMAVRVRNLEGNINHVQEIQQTQAQSIALNSPHLHDQIAHAHNARHYPMPTYFSHAMPPPYPPYWAPPYGHMPPPQAYETEPEHVLAVQTRRGASGSGTSTYSQPPALLPPARTPFNRGNAMAGVPARPTTFQPGFRRTAGARNLNAPISYRFPKTPLSDLDKQCREITQAHGIQSEDDPKYCELRPCIFCNKPHPGAYCPIAWSLGAGCPDGKYTAEQLESRRTLLQRTTEAPVMFSDAMECAQQQQDDVYAQLLCVELCAMGHSLPSDVDGTLQFQDACIPSEPVSADLQLMVSSQPLTSQ